MTISCRFISRTRLSSNLSRDDLQGVFECDYVLICQGSALTETVPDIPVTKDSLDCVGYSSY